jgi:phosphatidylserine/phosphatidylglycerophosphate/cardiolipin synthase-like enzyme
MAEINAFRVGGVPLNPEIVNKKSLEKMLGAIDKAEIEEGRSGVKQTVEDLFEHGDVGLDRVGDARKYNNGLKKEWKADKKAMFNAKNSDEANWDQALYDGHKSDLAANAPFLGAFRVFENEVRQAVALNTVKAVAGASFGPANAVAGYAAFTYTPNYKGSGGAFSNADTKKVGKLVETYNSYLSGDSKMITEGNSVKQAHGAELWKTLTGMTQDAAESADPQPITAQYYELTSPELVGNLASAAKAGSPLRINLDIGRLSFPSQDAKTGEPWYDVDDIATKNRTVQQFAGIEDADVGVSIYPAKQNLGSPSRLMHRKVLTVGDQTLMSGMNGNVDSGENVDAGYVIEGPAAKQFTENVARDMRASAGADLSAIYGDRELPKFETHDLRMGLTGLSALFDSQDGPSPAGTALVYPKDAAELEKMSKTAGVDLKSILGIEAEDWDSQMYSLFNEDGSVPLNEKGKKMLLGHMQASVDATNTPKNLKALNDISLPSGEKVGKTTVDIADSAEEREVLTINAIQQAEEFIYASAFVITRPVAAAIAAKHKESIANGKELDIRMVADPGVYPFGGTPNSWGVNLLEEHGVPVRWAKLTRHGDHDRKVHAKQLLTDKGEISGSTNFSKKGMRENHETAAYVRFEKGDAEAESLKDKSKAQFITLWEEDSYDVSTQEMANFFTHKAPEDGKEWFNHAAKGGATRTIITGIEHYEVESGAMVKNLMERDDVAARRDELIAEGYSDGNASLMAAEQVLGKDKFDEMKADLPSSIELERAANRLEEWKLTQ